MLKSRRNFRLGVCGGVIGAVYLGLAGSAMAWNEPLWVRQLGTETWDIALGVATDAAGNVYLAGSTQGSLGGANSGRDDAWVAKYDGAGHVLWKRQLGSDTSDNASGVATDAAGNVYLAGSTNGSLGGANSGRDDAWVAKYDGAGHVLWKRQLGTETSDHAYGVATDAAGNVYLTGGTRGSLGGANRGSGDAWVAKYDAAGHVLWKRQLGAADEDYASGVATDGAGNVYLTGWTRLARRRQSRMACLGGEVRRRRPCAVEAATRNGRLSTSFAACRPTLRATSTWPDGPKARSAAPIAVAMTSGLRSIPPGADQPARVDGSMTRVRRPATALTTATGRSVISDYVELRRELRNTAFCEPQKSSIASPRNQRRAR